LYVHFTLTVTRRTRAAKPEIYASREKIAVGTNIIRTRIFVLLRRNVIYREPRILYIYIPPPYVAHNIMTFLWSYSIILYINIKYLLKDIFINLFKANYFCSWFPGQVMYGTYEATGSNWRMNSSPTLAFSCK